MLSEAERAVLNSALEKYRPGQSEPILVGGENVLKPALGLMSLYRLRIEEIKGAEVVTSYTRWLECVQARGVENQDVYLTFSPNFERIWLEAKKRLPEYVSQKLANLGLRSQYSIRLYGWVKKHVTSGTKRISLEQLRKLLGLESVQDAAGKIIQAPFASLGEFSAKSVGYCDRGDHQEDGHKHRNRVACAIKISAGNVGDFFD
jgi:hypothetical protein